MISAIKITSLANIGANLSYNSVLPIVDINGVATTYKANLQNLGNYILSGAGGAYFTRAAQSNIALSVANAAQPNITSVGTLTSLTVSGNLNVPVASLKVSGGTNGYVLRTDGAGNLSWAAPTAGGNGSPGGSNTQVQFNDGGSFGGNTNFTFDKTTGILSANKFQGNIYNTGNIIIDAGGADFRLSPNGVISWPGGGDKSIGPDGNNDFTIHSHANLVIATDVGNTDQEFKFDSAGVFTSPGNVNLLGSRLNVGPDAATAGNLLNPTLIIANTGAQYIQAAIINNDETGSSDWSADGAGAGDEEAWTDMGFAGYAFNDPNYTITSPGDGYLFVQAYANGLGGNMVLATGDTSNTADIIFATGGFLAANEFARIDHANSLLHFTRAGSGIKFNDDTIQDTAGVVWTTAPVSNTSPGTPGQAAYDAGGNLFVCVAGNTWAKFAGTISW